MRPCDPSIDAVRTRWVNHRVDELLRERGPMKVLSEEYHACIRQAYDEWEAQDAQQAEKVAS